MLKVREYPLAISFSNIHRIISRGIRVSRESTHWFLLRPSQLPERQQGFLDYVRTLISVMDSHQLNEDYLVYPYFRDLLPDVPFDMMMSNHNELVHLFDEIESILYQCEERNFRKGRLRKLEIALARLNSVWSKHHQIEVEQFISKIDAVVDDDEQRRLVRLFEQYNQSHSEPSYRVIPFLLFNLPMEEREILVQVMPKEITHHLVPNVWKEKWESMKPFLLV